MNFKEFYYEQADIEESFMDDVKDFLKKAKETTSSKIITTWLKDKKKQNDLDKLLKTFNLRISKSGEILLMSWNKNKRQVKCTMCTKHRWFGNNKGRKTEKEYEKTKIDKKLIREYTNT